LSEIVVKVPDIGGAENVEVIEVSVAVGDGVTAEQTLVVLESDKASMEIPSPQSGVVKVVNVVAGDKISEGSAIVMLEVVTDQPATESDPPENVSITESAAEQAESPVVQADVDAAIEPVTVPDLGGASGVEVIELNVAVGDQVAQDDTLVVLESDKASMEIPSPFAGIVKSLTLKLGDKVDEGALIAELEIEGATETQSPEPIQKLEKPDNVTASKETLQPKPVQLSALPVGQTGGEVYAGPAVRQLARELGVDLAQVAATGPKGRVLKEDVQSYVKNTLSQGGQSLSASAIPAVSEIDFSVFGEIEELPLSRIQKLTAAAMQRSWLNVPHVAHFDEADITGLEEFRILNKEKAQKRELKLTPLPFLLKACAVALREHPHFNASLSGSGKRLIYKKYCNIGIAMNTPAGLMVPVIRDVDKKGIWELAKEMTELGIKGKEGKLSKSDLEGGCFTISSLGAIGGTGFTPIVNTPEVAILGVSRTQIKPVYIDEEFVPRKMLPLTLSYDHRAVNGVDAGQFVTCLTRLLADIRRLVM